MAFKPKVKEVTLSDERKVSVRSLTGADEMLALQLVASQLKQEELMAGLMAQSNMQVVLSVLFVDEKEVPTPRTFEAALRFMADFSLPDWNLIRAAYGELNGADEAPAFLEKSNT